MAAKFVIVALLVASVNASGGYSSFSYGVSDPNTGDVKDQQENRVGGNVVGKYSLLESDGTKRVVEYSADDATGFKAVVHKEPVGGIGAAAIGGHLAHSGAHGATAIGSPLSHPGHLAHAGALANPISHPASLAAVSPLVHATPLGGSGSLSHGAIPVAAHSAHAAKVAHANKLAHAAQTVSPFAHAGAFAAGSPLAHGAPVAPLTSSSPLTHGAYSNPLAYANAAGVAGHSNSLYGGYGHNRGAPTVSSYSHTIVHNGPDAFSNGGAYGRYGLSGYGGLGPHGAGLVGSALGHANPWASGAALAQANPWAPRPAPTHGALASPYTAGTGSRLGW